jgi:glyoxylase-like metal-dependent hydrolase (beta-lactamase superfamily II)
MRVHHLNCGSMAPVSGQFVSHVLLLETDHGLVLVDTGFGTADVRDPGRVGISRHLIKPVLRDEETALHQVLGLGFARDDVRHVVLTHFDVDHVGGLSDFPEALVHVTAAEAQGAVHAPSFFERQRYRSVQWAHGPRLVEHEPTGEAWRGFAAARELTEIAPGIVLVSLPGHSRGHAGVAIDTGEGWLLHAGDSYYDRAEITGGDPGRAIRLAQRSLAFDHAALLVNQSRLAELQRTHESDLRVFCAHDPSELADLAAR